MNMNVYNILVYSIYLVLLFILIKSRYQCGSPPLQKKGKIFQNLLVPSLQNFKAWFNALYF